ncbi:sensor domain-containing diguanylate cyclase, partial [bacterium]|nr:sensor domain-containing diguanylate cyclase [bacterium]
MPNEADSSQEKIPADLVDETIVTQLKEKMLELEQSFLQVKDENRLLSERLEETSILYKIAALLNSTYDTHRLYPIIQNMLSEISFIDQFVLFEKDQQGQMMVDFMTEKTKDKNNKNILDVEKEIAESVMRIQKEEYVPKVSHEKNYQKFFDKKNDACVFGVPFVSNKKVNKVLCFHSPRDLRENEKEFLRLISNETATAVERAKIYQHTLEISIKDELTKVFNRRYFNDRVFRELHRAKRYKRELSLIMIDIDHFKDFNDTYGHHIGDEVLRWVAKNIGESIRDSDILARYGGEEFVIILTETDKRGAFSVGEKVRKNV